MNIDNPLYPINHIFGRAGLHDTRSGLDPKVLQIRSSPRLMDEIGLDHPLRPNSRPR